jgi:hypothetical protein
MSLLDNSIVSLTFRGNGPILAIGDGPAQSVYQGALAAHLKDRKHWGDIHGGMYLTLNFNPKPDLVHHDSLIEFELDGVLTVLVLAQWLVEPYPVNPFLVYATFFPESEDMDFLRASYKEHQ